MALTDYIACAEDILDNNWAHHRWLVTLTDDMQSMPFSQ